MLILQVRRVKVREIKKGTHDQIPLALKSLSIFQVMLYTRDEQMKECTFWTYHSSNH